MNSLKLVELLDCWEEYLNGLRKAFLCLVVSNDEIYSDFIFDLLRRTGEINKYKVGFCNFDQMFVFQKEGLWICGDVNKNTFPHSILLNSGRSVFFVDKDFNFKSFQNHSYFLLNWSINEKNKIYDEVFEYVVLKRVCCNGDKIKSKSITKDVSCDPFVIEQNILKDFLSEEYCFENNKTDVSMSFIINSIVTNNCDKEMIITYVLNCENIHKFLFALKRKIVSIINQPNSNIIKLSRLISSLDKAEIDSRMFSYFKNINENIAVVLIQFFDEIKTI